MKRVLGITAAALCAALAIPQPAAAQDNPAARTAREWRQAREPQLLAEYFEVRNRGCSVPGRGASA